MVLSLLTKSIISKERRGSWGRAHPAGSSTPRKSRNRGHILQTDDTKNTKTAAGHLIISLNKHCYCWWLTIDFNLKRNKICQLNSNFYLTMVQLTLPCSIVFLTEQIFSLHLYEVKKSHVDAVKSLHISYDYKVPKVGSPVFSTENKDINIIIL